MWFFMPLYMAKLTKLARARSDVRSNNGGFLGFLIVLLGNMKCQDSENCFLNEAVKTCFGHLISSIDYI